MGTDNECPRIYPVEHSTRLMVNNVMSLEKKCFVCNVKRAFDDNHYNEGDLQRCSRDDTASKTLARKNFFLHDKTNRHYDVTKRLDILLSGSAHDIFPADIFYH